ncbi:hypothetical protein, partial [Nocardioides sp. SYSU DS0663]|uniref:hypothetical protein n=1 Tax=Nocardioides sp. SYSU DS0663 TaxID=3416445 RepID=UPI003F4C55E8
RRRRGALAAVGAAATVAAVALTAFLVSTSAGDDEPLAAAPSDQASADVSPDAAATPTLEPLPEPDAPTADARPAYRSVRFTVRPPRTPDQTTVQVDDGSGWRTLRTSAVAVRTEQGGERACLDARTVVRGEDGRTATSDVARSCGRAEPRTVRLVRTPGECTTVSQGFTYPCQWYGVEVAGFASGSRPRAELRPAEASRFCVQFERCRPVPVNADGRGRIPQWFRVATDSGVWVLSVDGVTTRTRLYYR